MKIRETNMSNGVDLIHYWNDIPEAIKSGRFDYLMEMDEDNFYETLFFNSETLEDFIKNIGYPFFIEK